MLTVERTRDMELVRRILTSPGTYRGKVDADKFQPISGEHIIYLSVKHRFDFIGLFVGVFVSEHELHVHHAFHPVAFRIWTRPAAEAAISWVWDNTQVLKMIGLTPAPLRSAIRFAKELGFQAFAIDEQSTIYKGEVVDQIMTELYRPKVQYAA